MLHDTGINCYPIIPLFFLFICRGTGVQCVLQFRFSDERYTGVVALQDALLRKELLHSMPVKTRYFTSSDGKETVHVVSLSCCASVLLFCITVEP